MSEERAKKALISAISAGYQLDRDALSFLEVLPETCETADVVKKAVEKASGLPQKPMFISRDLLEEAAEEILPVKETERSGIVEGVTGKEIFHPYAKEISAEMKIIADPTSMNSTGSIDDFLQCFRDRFNKIERLLRQRMDVRGAVSIQEALNARPNTEVKTIGLVYDRRERKRTIMLQIEDLENSATVMIPPSASQTVFEKAQKILLDQVICVCVTRSRGDLLIASDIILPDIPERKPMHAKENVCIALTSDLHIGSRVFLKDVLNRFILWLNGKLGSTRDRELAGLVKYVVIAGDLVDGIGVYPEQEKELEISDIYEQYRIAAQYIEQIPDYIEVVIIPGNHDATRQALPQPAIPKKYAEPIYSVREVTMLGDPATVQLHGVNLLLYHGRSLEDVIGSVPHLTYDQPEKAMELLLKARHVAPVYGKRTPIAPESHDQLIIEDCPDIFHVGHIHINGYESYRGTLLVNSGAWQKTTEYQRKMGLTPTPGRVPIVNLATMQLTEMDFMGYELST
ncbi:MAG TPA: DNA-directed DNA polymerase II small subunit [archaeon]|nr:DNA-directed DNA polymerase II small subunit [archaeon]